MTRNLDTSRDIILAVILVAFLIVWAAYIMGA